MKEGWAQAWVTARWVGYPALHEVSPMGCSLPNQGTARESMHCSIRFLQAGAMAGFLREMLLVDTPYVAGVQQDFARCMELHFQVGAGLLLG